MGYAQVDEYLEKQAAAESKPAPYRSKHHQKIKSLRVRALIVKAERHIQTADDCIERGELDLARAHQAKTAEVLNELREVNQ